MGACQNAMNDPFGWVVDTLRWHGLTGTYNEGGEQVIAQDRWRYRKPCCGPMGSVPQAGSEVPLRVAESHRLTNLVQFGGHLHVVLNSGPQAPETNNVMFWADLDCTRPAACVVAQTAKISGAGFIPAFPTVGVDARGNVGIVAVSSNATTNLSLLQWTHKTTDRPEVFNGPVTVVSGTQPFTCLNDKNFATIGNAVGVLTALDPRDGTKLWSTQQWGNDAARCVWNTRIVEYQVAP
jgi:hypothetical protein